MAGTSFTGASDATTLLTSILQAGAALVAIVAGLLGSRYVAMHGERQAAQRRLTDVQRRLSVAQAQHRDAHAALTEQAVRDILDDEYVYEAITQLGAQAAPDLDDLLNALGVDPEDLPRADLEAHLDHLTAELARAFREVDAALARLGTDDAWPAIKRAADLRPGHEEAWEWYFNMARGALRAEQQRAKEKAFRDRYGFSFDFGAADSVHQLLATPMSVLTPAERQARERPARELDEAARDLRFLEAEEHAALEHLRDSSQPEGFALALSVLAYLAATSIALPSVFLIFAQVYLQWWGRAAFVAAFLSGVALLLWYLLVYAQYLNGSRPALPKWFWGLVPSPRQPLARMMAGARQRATRVGTHLRARWARPDS